MPRRRQLTAAGADRRAEIVAMRSARQPWAEIAATFGISTTRAFQIYSESIAAAPSAAVAVHRAEIDALADRAIRGLLALAEDPMVAPGTRVAAWTGVEVWVRRLCRIHGGIEDIRMESRGFLGRAGGERIFEGQALAAGDE